MSVTPPVEHDRRCEARNTLAHRLTCRCHLRKLARELVREHGNAATVGNEEYRRESAGDLMEMLISKMTRGLIHAVREAGRVPLPMTLHLVSEQDELYDGTVHRMLVLTVPAGTIVDESMLEVADDWMRAKRAPR